MLINRNCSTVLHIHFFLTHSIEYTYSVRCTVYGVRCTVYGVRCTVYGVRCTVYGVRCTVYGVRCTVYGVQYTINTCGSFRVRSTNGLRDPHQIFMKFSTLAECRYCLENNSSKYSAMLIKHLSFFATRQLLQMAVTCFL